MLKDTAGVVFWFGCFGALLDRVVVGVDDKLGGMFVSGGIMYTLVIFSSSFDESAFFLGLMSGGSSHLLAAESRHFFSHLLYFSAVPWLRAPWLRLQFSKQ